MDALSSLGLPRCVLSWTPCRSNRALVSGSPQASASSRPSFSSRSASALLSAPAQTSASGSKNTNYIQRHLHHIKLCKAANQSRLQFQGYGLRGSEQPPAYSAARKIDPYVLLLPLLLEHLRYGDREQTFASRELVCREKDREIKV